MENPLQVKFTKKAAQNLDDIFCVFHTSQKRPKNDEIIKLC